MGKEVGSRREDEGRDKGGGGGYILHSEICTDLLQSREKEGLRVLTVYSGKGRGFLGLGLWMYCILCVVLYIGEKGGGGWGRGDLFSLDEIGNGNWICSSLSVARMQGGLRTVLSGEGMCFA